MASVARRAGGSVAGGVESAAGAPIRNARGTLFSSDTANYRDNLDDGEPRLWVALRRQDGGPELELTKVTADPTEVEAMFESGCEVIGTVPMPPEIAAWVAAFVEQFHVERIFHKRKRDRAGGDRQRMPDSSHNDGKGGV